VKKDEIELKARRRGGDSQTHTAPGGELSRMTHRALGGQSVTTGTRSKTVGTCIEGFVASRNQEDTLRRNQEDDRLFLRKWTTIEFGCKHGCELASDPEHAFPVQTSFRHMEPDDW
jgi:hypothetical protein